MQAKTDAIHIVYASDDRFARVLGVSIASVLMTEPDAGRIDITVLDGGITPENRRKIDDTCRKYGCGTPRYLKMDDLTGLLGERVQTDRGSIMQYARIFMGRLPYDRVLYLDCDVMLRKPVSELWNTALGDKIMAAVPDVFSRYYRKGMELEPDEAIYNNGVMLVDLEKWRQQGIEEKVLAFIRRHFGRPIKDDLGALNGVLSRDTLALSPSWNAVTAFYDFTYEEMLYYRKPPAYYPKETVEMAAANPFAVHFTSSFCSVRPWEKGCRHPFAGEYEKIKRTTPWADDPLAEPRKSMPTRLLNSLPWGLRLRIAACLQAYIRPLYSLFRERTRKVGH